MKCWFFFSIAATLRVQSARWTWPSSPVPPCCPRVWCVTALLLTTHFFLLLSAEVDISAVNVRPSGLQDCSCTLVMVPASLSWTCGHWVGCGPCVVSWPQPAATGPESGIKSSLSVRCPRAALMRVFFSWKVTLLSCCLPLAPSLASSSAFSFPGRPQWAGTHCGTIHLCCAT